MEDYIQISKLNDFIFCPKSLYFHSLFESFDQKTYHDTPQTVGKISHEIIDKGQYSSLKKYLQGLEIFSDKYSLCGKIDIYDKDEGILIERKYKVKKIYQGYIYQLYAQMFCLQEMGYRVNKLFIHSLSDNKRYPIDLPTVDEIKIFEDFIHEVRSFDILKSHYFAPPAKCAMCIYKPLCH
ncbi:type V CRISPR-associated protein Cas4 [Candidatus Peregrinibacteria bacterium]|nr:type V CRISPR-associated protein Cas4 [Candidatus Peregrinibacteria bacterium]